MSSCVPLIPQLGREALPSRVWSIVLTGDAPPTTRRRPPRRGGRGARRWPPTGEPPSCAVRTVERAHRLAAAGQALAVLTRRHAAAWAPELAVRPEVRGIVQPTYRGRAAELLLPLLKIARRDPSAAVVVLPADLRVDHDARFHRAVGRAVWAVTLRPDLPILLGAPPETGGRDGWIEPGAPVEGLEDLAVYTVKGFVDGASATERRRLLDAGALTSTSIFVARAGTLRDLAARELPEILEALEPLEDVFDRPEESLLGGAVYECMPEASLAPLERAPGLGVLALPDAVGSVTEPEALLLAS